MAFDLSLHLLSVYHWWDIPRHQIFEIVQSIRTDDFLKDYWNEVLISNAWVCIISLFGIVGTSQQLHISGCAGFMVKELQLALLVLTVEHLFNWPECAKFV